MSLGFRTRQNLHAAGARLGGTDLHGIASSVARLGDRWWMIFGTLGAKWRMAEIEDGLVMVRLAVDSHARRGPRARDRWVLQEAGL